MINLYDSKETNFNNNGIVILNDAINCVIIEELNGQYELEMEYPLLDSIKRIGIITPIKIVGKNLVGEIGTSQMPNKWIYLLEGNIIKADDQLFRIYRKIKTLTSIKINARHIFYDLLDNLLEDVRPTTLNGSGALDWILTHTQYAHPFTSSSDVTTTNTQYFVRKNPVEAIMADGLIANWGGELVRDNFSIALMQARGADRGVLVAYGKNIQGIEETLDIDGLCTKLMPIGKDGLLLVGKYINSPYINNYVHPKIKIQEFSDCENVTTLLAAGQKYMLDNKIDIPQFNYKIDFLELSKTEEYKNYAVLERVYMADTVTIKHSKLGINLKAKVIKATKNVLTNRMEKLELGSFKTNIATVINNAIQEVKKEIVQVTSAYKEAIDNATSLITGSKGGNVVIRQHEDGKPYEILIMDTDDIMTAQNVWRWNLGGFGYSSTGIDGTYGTAITMDGHIVASFITALTINASQIIGGTITGDMIKGGTIVGSSIQQTNGATVLNEFGKNVNGGTLIINDIGGNQNVYLGSESTSSPTSIGGMMQIFNDGPVNVRAKLSIEKATDSGSVHLYDSAGVNRAQMSAYIPSYGAGVIFSNATGVVKSWATENGFGGLGKKAMATSTLTIALGTAMAIPHNLGYYPIVIWEGSLGTYIMNYTNDSVNQIRVFLSNSSSTAWTGTVYFY